MKWMDGARRWGGLGWVAAGLVFQLVVVAVDQQVPDVVTCTLLGVVVLLAAVCLLGSPRLVWAVGWIAAIVLALDFGGAVADRFGALGRPGGPWVSWGSWAAFTDYTAMLLPAALRSLAPLAAVLATGVEVGLAVGLLFGWQRRWVAKAAAGLLTVYLVAMAFSLGPAAVARYAVPVLIGGALLVSTCPRARPGRTPPTLAATRARPAGIQRGPDEAPEGVS